jgi:hypothetical protein
MEQEKLRSLLLPPPFAFSVSYSSISFGILINLTQIWRVQDYERVEAMEGGCGNFYVGDAYVILYTYIWKNVERYIIYFYQGRDATIVILLILICLIF